MEERLLASDCVAAKRSGFGGALIQSRTGSRWGLLLRGALRLRLILLNLCLLNYAIRGERIVVNGNERVVIEIRLMVHRHQRVIEH
ncbi:hypothetical protein ACVIGA_004986 [Bradyrhizobium sp. USDA 3240]